MIIKGHITIICFLLFPIIVFGQGKISRKPTEVHQNTHTPYIQSGEINGYGFVDLGLPSGKKWATCNVGADSPYGEGLFFMWGSTEPQKEYLIKETRSKDIIRTMDEFAGNTQFDAASKHMGEPWRTPTIEELKELVSECKWQFISTSDFKGYKGIGPNGNTILLPCTSWYKFLSQDQYKFYKHSGQYWSSSLEKRYADCAYVMKFAKELGFSPTVYYDMVNHNWDFYESAPTYARRTIRAITD